MVLLIALITFFYTLVLLKLILGLQLLKKGTNQTELAVSIIVAARNEEQNIEDCINSLIAQNYPAEKLEIIIVDDRSKDATANIVTRFANSCPNIFLIQVKDSISGMASKKHAINLGIAKATGEIILITDADCRPQTGWVKSIISYFEPNVGLVAGFSPLNRTLKPSLFSKLIQLDSLALAAVSAGSIGAGFPLTCNARNLAYRKSLYQQVGGFEEIGHLISGDDDLFLHLVTRKTDWQIRYNIDKQAIVSSKAPLTFKVFFHQRVRHASKVRYYSLGLKFGLFAVYLFNVLLLGLLLLSWWKAKFLLFFSVPFFLKALFEFMLLYKTATIFSCQAYLKYFPLAAIFHIPYTIIFGLWGQIGKFSWKGDTFHAKLKPTTRMHEN